MFAKLKQLLKHSVFYSLSNAAIKASGIVLLPLYTSKFTVAEYGRLGLILISIIIVSQSLILGQGISVIRFNNLLEFREKRKSIFFTLTIFVLFLILLFIIFSNLFIYNISSLFGDPDAYKSYLKIAILITAVITLNNLFLSKLRADENSLLYTASVVIKIIVMIVLNFYFIIGREMGIEGALYALLAGEISLILTVLPKLLSQMKIRFETGIIKNTVMFGFPLIFSSMAINLLNGSDRFIIRYLLGEKDLGLYELGYRIAGIMSMFIIIPFGMTLIPMAYKIYKQQGDKNKYSKLKTYSTFIFVWIGLAISLFGKELIELFAQNPSFYNASTVVPLIVLAYIFYGMSMISSLGMYLTGNNKYIAYITIFCAGLNIGLNFIIIPKFGILGAAFNTVLSFIILDILSNLASNKYYKINYEHLKIVKALTIGVFLYGANYFIAGYLSFLLNILFKVLIIAVFPLLLYKMHYFDKEETKRLKEDILIFITKKKEDIYLFFKSK